MLQRIVDKFTNKSYTRKELITAGLIASGSLLTLYLGKQYFNGGTCRIVKDLTGKVIVITGANTGIGKETARELAQMGATIVLAARDTKKTLAVVDEIKRETKNQNIEFIQLDLSDLTSVRNFANEFKAKYNRLDILINNAGVMALLTRQTTKNGFETQFGVNHLGHFYLTKLLIDVIKASGPSRIINLSSLAHVGGKINWDDLMYQNNYAPYPAYQQSKLANVMFSRELQRRMDLEKVDVKVMSVHPGFVDTELTRHVNESILYRLLTVVLAPVIGLTRKSALQGAQTTLYCALEDKEKLRGGAYYADCKEAKTNPLGLDDEACVRLWNVSENLVSEAIAN